LQQHIGSSRPATKTVKKSRNRSLSGDKESIGQAGSVVAVDGLVEKT